jgi:hypothetical protein
MQVFGHTKPKFGRHTTRVKRKAFDAVTAMIRHPQRRLFHQEESHLSINGK